jgi:hypothetical protein
VDEEEEDEEGKAVGGERAAVGGVDLASFRPNFEEEDHRADSGGVNGGVGKEESGVFER